jgi:hypothetical protein
MQWPDNPLIYKRVAAVMPTHRFLRVFIRAHDVPRTTFTFWTMRAVAI